MEERIVVFSVIVFAFLVVLMFLILQTGAKRDKFIEHVLEMRKKEKILAYLKEYEQPEKRIKRIEYLKNEDSNPFPLFKTSKEEIENLERMEEIKKFYEADLKAIDEYLEKFKKENQKWTRKEN